MGPKELEKVIAENKIYKKMIEEMALLPKEEMGKREPGEVGTYELSRVPEKYRKGYKQAVKEGKSEEFIQKMRMESSTDSRMPLGCPRKPAGAFK